jgi:hypothetical protein
MHDEHATSGASSCPSTHHLCNKARSVPEQVGGESRAARCSAMQWTRGGIKHQGTLSRESAQGIFAYSQYPRLVSSPLCALLVVQRPGKMPCQLISNYRLRLAKLEEYLQKQFPGYPIVIKVGKRTPRNQRERRCSRITMTRWKRMIPGRWTYQEHSIR